MIEDKTKAEAERSIQRGTLALSEGRVDAAMEALLQAETLFRQLHDAAGLAQCRIVMGEAQQQNGATRSGSRQL